MKRDFVLVALTLSAVLAGALVWNTYRSVDGAASETDASLERVREATEQLERTIEKGE